jgi:hypothetical protein
MKNKKGLFISMMMAFLPLSNVQMNAKVEIPLQVEIVSLTAMQKNCLELISMLQSLMDYGITNMDTA